MNSLILILNLIIIECLLSLDNSIILATMVSKLPKEQQSKALKYGIIGAYMFRGLSLLVITWLVKIWWLKVVGGLYLLWLAFDHFKTKIEEETGVVGNESRLYKKTIGYIGVFWTTVIAVELLDLAMSIDNCLAVVAFTDNIYIICAGVFIGILAMRFVAQGFVKLMEKYKFLETVAFLVIGLLGLKLITSLYTHYNENDSISKFLESEHTDMYVSVITILMFVIPILTCIFFNYPKRTSLNN